ncbi:hypothetical protein [Enterococcus sp. JM9B]|uniref:hypothetical protein n=1 Tax=Enterococcus sp. JM9B TaxID=1857216 RepID=UPI001374C576|nr:hypothetical protein [Enterococcus sp. JM9B]KAF1300909.1 hypothetical protein BAU16_11045 [Enterococcus sp. JM9B]
MDFVKEDFDYYRRSIQLMYQGYYRLRLSLLAVCGLLLAVYSAITRDSLLINGFLLLILIALFVYLVLQSRKFDEIYDAFLRKNQPAQIYQLVEDEYSYTAKETGQEEIHIKKVKVRNFPSRNKQFTLMVGFEKAFFSSQPLQMVYYDMLELTYEESFRLKRNGYSRLPRFLRRFSLTNIKGSITDLFRFIFGNIFLLFLVYRLIRYLLALLRM